VIIYFHSVTCDGVIIDHVIDMIYQYSLHPKTKSRFQRLNFKKPDLTCSDRDHGFSPSYIKTDFEIGM